MTLLTKDQILASRELPREKVAVPELEKDGYVLLQGLSAGDADRFNASLIRRNGQRQEVDREHYCAKLLSLCLVGENGQRVLSEGDVLLLSQQSAAVVYRLTMVAERLSGLNIGAVEGAAKN